MRGVGRNADHASLAGRGDDHQLAKLDVAAALRDHTHAAAVVEVDVADGNAPAVGERETGVVTRSRAEYHHVADRGGQVFAQNADVAVGAFFGRDRPVRQPVVRGTERRFAPHGVELQQVGEGVHRTLGIAETQAAVDDVAEVIFGELDFQPTVALRHNGALGIERTGEVDRQVAHRNVLTVFEAERRDEAREEQFGAVAVDLEVAHTHQVERDALEALVVVADELVLFDRPVGAHAELAAGQHEPRGADLGTVFQRGPHGGHGIRPGSAGRKEIFQVDGFFRRRCRIYGQDGQQGGAAFSQGSVHKGRIFG